MLFLLFQIGPGRYALNIHDIAEVLPLVQISVVPALPAGVVGVLNYRGVPIPVVDLSLLLLQRPALRRFNTRLIIVRYRPGTGDEHLLGLIVERATETLRRDPGDFAHCGVDGQPAGSIGPVALDDSGVVQRTELHQLIPASLRDLLFQAPAAPP